MPWLYSYLGIFYCVVIANSDHQHMLKTLFNKEDYRRVRLLENLIIASPFFLILLFHQEYLVAITLMIFASAATYMPPIGSFDIATPTPFKSKPFELIQGFRSFWPILALHYGIACIGVHVQNPNLVLFLIASTFLNSLRFFTEPEYRGFIWIHNSNSFHFLRLKIINALIGVSILVLPLVALSFIFFESQLLPIIAIISICYILLVTVILAKYSTYPNRMNIVQLILIVVSLIFPPFFIYTIALFYKKSINKLNLVLE